MKNKNLLIGVGAVVVLLLVGGGFLFLNKSKNASSQTNSTANVDTGSVQTLSPSDIGLALTATSDKQKVQFSVAKLSGIKAISYELTYEADSTASEKEEGADARVQRGITGDAQMKSGDSKYTSPWLDLGSCSRNVCRYDTGVDSVDLVLKITKDNGQVYQAEQKLNL